MSYSALSRKVFRFVKANGLLQQGEDVCLSLSGGADSVFLLHWLIEQGYRFRAFHINYQLRGSESDEDEEFCRDLCRRSGVELTIERVELKKREGVQSEARYRRMKLWEKHRRGSGRTVYLLGHQMDDHCETILFRLLRGSGWYGLRGIDPRIVFANGIVVERPLLSLTREEIREELRRRGVEYREDSSNSQLIYERNRLRLGALRFLAEVFGDHTVRTRLSAIGRAAAEAARLTRNLYEANRPDRDALPLNWSKHSDIVLRYMIREWLQRCGGSVTRDRIQNILELIRAGKGALNLDDRRVLLWEGEVLRIKQTKVEPCYFYEDLPIPGEVETPLGTIKSSIGEPFRPVEDSRVEFIDREKIKGTLRIRTRRAGDWFIPIGMKGGKKLKKFFIENKVSRQLREKVPLVVDDEKIIWVVGFRLDDRVKIEQDAGSIIRLELVGPE